MKKKKEKKKERSSRSVPSLHCYSSMKLKTDLRLPSGGYYWVMRCLKVVSIHKGRNERDVRLICGAAKSPIAYADDASS